MADARAPKSITVQNLIDLLTEFVNKNPAFNTSIPIKVSIAGKNKGLKFDVTGIAIFGDHIRITTFPEPYPNSTEKQEKANASTNKN